MKVKEDRQAFASHIIESDPIIGSPPNKPFDNRRVLFVMHFCFAFVSRMWDMGIVLLIAELTNNSLFLVALTGLLSSTGIFFCMPFIGSWLDSTNRFKAVQIALSFKIVFVTVAYLICAYLSYYAGGSTVHTLDISIHRSSGSSPNSLQPVHEVEVHHQFPLLVYSLPIVSAVVAMAFCAITQSIEQDWIVVLSNKDSEWLSSTNSIMTQIDLGCSSLAPALTGLLFSRLSQSWSSLVLLAVNGLATLALYHFMKYLYFEWPALGRKLGVDEAVMGASDNLNSIDTAIAESDPDVASTVNGSYRGSDVGTTSSEIDAAVQRTPRRVSASASEFNRHPSAGEESGRGSGGIVESLTRLVSVEIRDFSESGCVGVMVSYAALYLTVLSFGSLMTVYTRWAGVSDAMIGVYRGLAALSGYSGALIFPFCSKHLGLHRSAQIAITYQFVLVAIAASSFFWTTTDVSVYVVIFAVLFSRTGLWLFDLCARQIAQETIPEATRGKVNGQWRSLIALFEVGAYVLAVFISAPSQFWVLTTVSASMIGFALVVYTCSNGNGSDYCCGGLQLSPRNTGARYVTLKEEDEPR